jgi:LEA14-like dessication related protein
MRKFFWLSFLVGLLALSCRSAPVPDEAPPPPLPLPSLIFSDIHADTPDDLKLSFDLTIKSPLPANRAAYLHVGIESWHVEMNGRRAHSGFALQGWQGDFAVMPETSRSFPLTLNMDVAALTEEGLAPLDDYEVNLIVQMRLPYNETVQVSAIAAFPGVRAPVFSITDIAILQAELINTRFRVGLQIDNPNPFPVDLSALSYELYGNGRFWAQGRERDVISIPPRTTIKGDLLLLMNFMGMRRALLDQIINLVDVYYRFLGEAQVSTGVAHLPLFTTRFDIYGYSRVLGNHD